MDLIHGAGRWLPHPKFRANYYHGITFCVLSVTSFVLANFTEFVSEGVFLRAWSSGNLTRIRQKSWKFLRDAGSVCIFDFHFFNCRCEHPFNRRLRSSPKWSKFTIFFVSRWLTIKLHQRWASWNQIQGRKLYQQSIGSSSARHGTRSVGARVIVSYLNDYQGSKKTRERILVEFIKANRNKTGPQLERDFGNSASLFLIRLTSWFRLTLVMLNRNTLILIWY